MNFDYSFRTANDKLDRADLKKFLQSQSLNYPAYENWVGKAISQLEQGNKSAILVYDNSSLVGDIVLQRHKEYSELIELKNIRMRPEYRHKGFASFMIKLAEVEQSEDISGLIVDAHEGQEDICSFLEFSGYNPIGKANLYSKSSKEIVYLKPIKNIEVDKLIEKLGLC